MAKPRYRVCRALLTSRPGMTVIIVLGVISIAMALSYAMMRAQTTSIDIQSNLERKNLARQAAYAGISTALRKMHYSTWAGVETPLQDEVGREQWFEVSFSTGDKSLTPASPDYSEYPFRVTIDSTGYAADPARPAARSSYRVRAVAQLVRKKLQPPPGSWAPVKFFTAYQWSGSASTFEFPVRLEGPLWLQGTINISTDYPSDSNSRSTYYADLLAMRDANIGDYRPLNGPIATPFSKQTGSNRSFMQSWGLTLYDVNLTTDAPASYPTSGQMYYQLYPGGKTYTLPSLQTVYGNTLTGVTLAPDPLENPLGIYLSAGTLLLNTDTKITGTIVTTGTEPDVRIIGKNVTLEAQTLPAVKGVTAKHQLPVAIVKDDFQLVGDAGCTIRGVVAAWDEFVFERGVSSASCDMKGRVVANKLHLHGRAPWDLTTSEYQAELANFNLQRSASGGIRYFPQWLKATRDFEPKPLLSIKANAPDIVDHWHTFGQPVYTYGNGDDGLRWNLLQWTDNPPIAP